jgi:hypothetical protein
MSACAEPDRPPALPGASAVERGNSTDVEPARASIAPSRGTNPVRGGDCGGDASVGELSADAARDGPADGMTRKICDMRAAVPRHPRDSPAALTAGLVAPEAPVLVGAVRESLPRRLAGCRERVVPPTPWTLAAGERTVGTCGVEDVRGPGGLARALGLSLSFFAPGLTLPVVTAARPPLRPMLPIDEIGRIVRLSALTSVSRQRMRMPVNAVFDSVSVAYSRACNCGFVRWCHSFGFSMSRVNHGYICGSISTEPQTDEGECLTLTSCSVMRLLGSFCRRRSRRPITSAPSGCATSLPLRVRSGMSRSGGWRPPVGISSMPIVVGAVQSVLQMAL